MEKARVTYTGNVSDIRYILIMAVPRNPSYSPDVDLNLFHDNPNFSGDTSFIIFRSARVA